PLHVMVPSVRTPCTLLVHVTVESFHTPSATTPHAFGVARVVDAVVTVIVEKKAFATTLKSSRMEYETMCTRPPSKRSTAVPGPILYAPSPLPSGVSVRRIVPLSAYSLSQAVQAGAS